MDTDLQHAFASGKLIRTDWKHPNLVDLVRALAILAGVPDLPQTTNVKSIQALIPESDHVIFALIDGMGLNLVQRLAENSFTRSHLRMDLISVFPSTTAAALTSIATGEFPNRHAVPGWWTHLPEFGLSSTILPFVDRFTHHSLTERGLTAEKVFPIPALHPRMTHVPLSVLPARLPNSVYSVYSRGGTAAAGYWAIDSAVDEIINRIRTANHRTYTYFYISDVDTLSHFRGWDHEDVIALTTWIDAQLARLADAVAGRARVVIGADHGHTKVPLAERIPIFHLDSILDLLEAPPSGNPPTPIFHVKPNRLAEFAKIFRDRFSARYSLVSTDEAEAIELWGPGKISDIARRRFGDFIGIARGATTLKYYEHGRIPAADDLGGHSGLTPDEMRIPLSIA